MGRDLEAHTVPDLEWSLGRGSVDLWKTVRGVMPVVGGDPGELMAARSFIELFVLTAALGSTEKCPILKMKNLYMFIRMPSAAFSKTRIQIALIRHFKIS